MTNHGELIPGFSVHSERFDCGSEFGVAARSVEPLRGNRHMICGVRVPRNIETAEEAVVHAMPQLTEWVEAKGWQR